MALTDNMRGAALMAGSMTAFVINDGFMKLVLVDVPVFQATFLRGLGITLCLIVLCHILGQLRFAFSRKDWVLIVLRSLSELISTVFFLSALRTMPLANLSAILQALPLTITLAGAIVFREAIGWRRMLAILVGFAGVLLIIQPGAEGFTSASFYALGAVAFVAIRDLCARPLSAAVPSVTVALTASIGVTVFSGIGSTFAPWATVTWPIMGLLSGAMICLVCGYVFSVQTMRVGEISFVAPFRYTSLVVAIILGYLAFGEFPDAGTLIGAAIIVATGLFTLYREARLKRTPHRQMGRLR